MPHVCIISAGRPGNVPAMEALCTGLFPTWYVPADEVADYTYAGADNVSAGGDLCEARNAALDDADGRLCVQLSDDLRRVEWTECNQRADVVPCSVADAIDRLRTAMTAHSASLAGCAPTANPYFYRRAVTTNGFIVGDFIAVLGGCPLRFATELRLKEDYDYTCQHLATYGVVARVDGVLATFAHRTNRGGAVRYRTSDVEQASIDWLKARWPDAIKDNARRPNEVLLRWKPQT